MAGITTITIAGQKVKIDVSQSGVFHATLDDEDYSAKTYADLVKQLRGEERRLLEGRKIPLSFVDAIMVGGDVQSGRGVLDVTLRGAHQRQHGVFLLATTSGEKFQYGGWGSSKMKPVRRLTQEEREQYNLLTATLDGAIAAYEAWLDARRVSLHDLMSGEEADRG